MILARRPSKPAQGRGRQCRLLSVSISQRRPPAGDLLPRGCHDGRATSGRPLLLQQATGPERISSRLRTSAALSIAPGLRGPSPATLPAARPVHSSRGRDGPDMQLDGTPSPPATKFTFRLPGSISSNRFPRLQEAFHWRLYRRFHSANPGPDFAS